MEDNYYSSQFKRYKIVSIENSFLEEKTIINEAKCFIFKLYNVVVIEKKV